MGAITTGIAMPSRITALVAAAACMCGLAWAGTNRSLAGTCPEIDFEDFDSPPSRIEGPPAEYPQLAMVAGQSGEVAMRVRVLPDGSICDVEVLDAPSVLFRSSARRAIAASTYAPALRDSVPVAGIALCSYLFEPIRPDIRDMVFGQDPASPFISDLVESGGAKRRVRGDSEYFEFEGIEIRGDLPLGMFRSLQRQIREDGPAGEDLYVVEVTSVAYWEPTKRLVYRPTICLYFCAERLADGRCTKSSIVYVSVLRDGFEFGRTATLHTDYTAK